MSNHYSRHSPVHCPCLLHSILVKRTINMCETERLIYLIRRRPAIYNFRLKDHSDKAIIEKLWQEVAAKMKLPVAECRNKYTALRNSYARHLRHQPPPGFKANKKKKQWYLADAMSFLKDYMMLHRKNGGNNTNTPPGQTTDGEDSMSSISSSVDEPPDMNNSNEYIPSTSIRRNRKRKLSAAASTPASASTDKMSESMLEFFKGQLIKSEFEDPNLTFFKSVLPDMKKLSDIHQRKMKQDFLFNLNRLLEHQETMMVMEPTPVVKFDEPTNM